MAQRAGNYKDSMRLALVLEGKALKTLLSLSLGEKQD